MARFAVEHDFFSMEKESTHHAKLESGTALGDIQSVIPKTDPELLNPQLPVFSPISRLCCGTENGTKNVPLTIFYDGTVTVFDVSSDEAEAILRFAESSKIMDAFTPRKQLFVETLSGDLPLARRNSLLRFLEKRKERLTMVSPDGLFQSPIFGSLGYTASKSKNQQKIGVSYNTADDIDKS
ncbi:protein TIFY 9-like [Lycium ferocissimum]|uniref:protein TIFY 9-like n=1 Tax=Lycium ferocissimum TaxID=112874 RepID=UPI002814B781|nr:protein TIFY 9-like [Lycium ferocissimum]